MSGVLNAFGAPCSKSDVFGAFELLSEGEKHIKSKQLSYWVSQMGLGFDKKTEKAIFKELDTNRNNRLEFSDLEKVFAEADSWSDNLRKFFEALMSMEFLFDTSKKCTNSPKEITALLKDIKGKWQHRIVAMNEFVIRYTNEKVKPATFDAEMKKTKKGWTLQLKDRRSAVCRAACIALGKLAQRRPRQMAKWSDYLMAVLFECNRIKIEVIHVSARNCLNAFVENVPDPLKRLPIFSTLCKQAQENFVDSRLAAWELITLKCDYYITKKGLFPDSVWKELKKILTMDKYGIRDADSQVRLLAYGLLARAEKLGAAGHEEIMRKLLYGVVKKAFEDEKARLLSEGLIPSKSDGNSAASPKAKQMAQRMVTATGVQASPDGEEKDNSMATIAEVDPNAPAASPFSGFGLGDDDGLAPMHDDGLSPLPEMKQQSSDDLLSPDFEAPKQRVRKSILRLGTALQARGFSSKGNVADTLMRTAMAIIHAAEQEGVDQDKTEAYLASQGIPRELIEEGYKEYCFQNNMYSKEFQKRPLGFSVVTSRKGVIVAKLQDKLLTGVEVGSRIISVNGHAVNKQGYEKCMRHLQREEMPLQIRFKARRRTKITEKKKKKELKHEEMEKAMDIDEWLEYTEPTVDKNRTSMLQTMSRIVIVKDQTGDQKARGTMARANRGNGDVQSAQAAFAQSSAGRSKDAQKAFNKLLPS